MNPDTLRRLETAAHGLRPLGHQFVFVGGATIEFWITDEAAPPFRPTDDIDVTVEVATRAEYHALEEQLRRIGFRHDEFSGVICRFLGPDSDLILDVIPTTGEILGFEDRWLSRAFDTPRQRTLPSGESIQVIEPTLLFASKIEAFNTWGEGDLYGSRDSEDIVTMVDGRFELVSELAGSSEELRKYVAEEIAVLSKLDRFENAVEGALPMGPETSDRAHQVLLPRFRQIIDLT